MTPQEVRKLSDEELRIRVAELCGWTDIHQRCRGLRYKATESGCCDLRGSDPSLAKQYTDSSPVPHYPADLNAMQEACSLLYDKKLYEKFVDILTGEVCLGHTSRLVKACEATARQRAEAFVLTLEPERKLTKQEEWAYGPTGLAR